MPATSQQQQKLFGLALSVKRGETLRSEVSDDVLNIVDTMSEKKIKDFAETSHKGLPAKIEYKIRETVREIMRDAVIDELTNESNTIENQKMMKHRNKLEIKLSEIVNQFESVNEGKKRFYQQDGVGKSKYTISYYDGKGKHKDGSDFYGIKTFKNKADLDAFRQELLKRGYREDSGHRNESVNLPLNEDLGDSIKKIRNLAVKMAKQNFNKATPHINMGNINPNTKFDGNSALSAATQALSNQSQIDEGLRDTINKFASRLFKGSSILSLISGVVSLEGWSNYLNASFNKWYYTNIQKLAEPGVMRVMQDIHGAGQSEGSLYGKFGMYAFFIFFTIAIISLAIAKVTRSKKESVNEASRRATDFFGDSKHGKAIHQLLGGKWDSRKVKKYLDSISLVGSKYARLMDFIAGDLGLDTRKYKTVGEMEGDMLKSMETLYKDFLSESVEVGVFTQKSVNENKEVVLSNQILDFLQKRKLITGVNAQKIHKELTAFLRNKAESVNEVASRTAMEIGGLTGMNKNAIQKFVDDNNLDIEKVFQYVKKGKLAQRMDLVTAIAGKPNNPIQQKMIKMFGESVNEYSVNKKFGSKYDIGAGSMGSGTTFWNRAEEEFGDYKKIAHVSDNGVVKFYDKALPTAVKKHIEDYAKTKNESVNEAKSLDDMMKDANRIKKELAAAQKEYSKSKTETNKAKVEAKKGQLERVANAIRNARADQMR
jgi:Arc/MetJ family transcription regulator